MPHTYISPIAQTSLNASFAVILADARDHTTASVTIQITGTPEGKIILSSSDINNVSTLSDLVEAPTKGQTVITLTAAIRSNYLGLRYVSSTGTGSITGSFTMKAGAV